MTQFACLSKPDPEWLVAATSIRPSQLHVNDITNERFLRRVAFSRIHAHKAAVPAVPESNGVIVTHLELNHPSGHAIPCRTYVPEVKPSLGEKPGHRFPLLYWVFGGGFCRGSQDDDDAMLRDLALKLRITCVSVGYRLAPENPFPAGVNDVYAGLKWALANANSISLDITKGVLVGGLSAGGNLAAVISNKSLTDGELRGKITGQLLIMPCLIMPGVYPDKWKHVLLSLEQNKDAMAFSKALYECNINTYSCNKLENKRDPDMSPLLAPSFKGLPSTYIQVAGWDVLRDEGFLYERLLRQAGVETGMDVYPGVPHCFHNWTPNINLARRQKVDFRSAIKWLLRSHPRARF